MKLGSLTALLCVASAVALAAPITVHNTGVGPGDTLVAPGAVTSFWELSVAPVGASEALGSNPFRFNCCYVADNLVSAWVSPQASGNASVGGYYTYELEVDLTGLDPSTAVIAGSFSTDNDGSIAINGNVVLTTGFGGFGAMHPFTMSSGFVAGINKIQATVNNGGNPTAFRVEFSRADASELPVGGEVPEPASLALLGSGLFAGAAFRFFRRR